MFTDGVIGSSVPYHLNAQYILQRGYTKIDGYSVYLIQIKSWYCKEFTYVKNIIELLLNSYYI